MQSTLENKTLLVSQVSTPRHMCTLPRSTQRLPQPDCTIANLDATTRFLSLLRTRCKKGPAWTSVTSHVLTWRRRTPLHRQRIAPDPFTAPCPRAFLYRITAELVRRSPKPGLTLRTATTLWRLGLHISKACNACNCQRCDSGDEKYQECVQ